MAISSQRNAHAIGTPAVGIGRAGAIENGAGQTVDQRIVGSVLRLVTHEAMHAPVSDRVHDQL